MVAVSAFVLGYAALALARVQAAPFNTGAVTTIEDVSTLDQNNPAFGRPVDAALHAVTEVAEAPEVAPDAVPEAANATEADITPLEVVSSPDLDRLAAFFGAPMERNANRLVRKAETQPIAWPGSYWPVYQDGINYRWNGGASPAEKYARAFGLDVKAFMDTVSRDGGILSMSGNRACSSNADCAGLNDGSVCGRRYGEARGYCIPTWYGICHAWAPAAMLEAEPKCPVTKNGVTFRPFDIKALLTQVYDGAGIGIVFTGARYDGPTSAPTDQWGRFKDAAYRDLNPGFFHIAMANILGRFKRSFILDVTANAEVWNQPIRSYEVLEQTQLTPQAAAQRFFRTNTYPFNAGAASILYVRTNFKWIVEGYEDGPLVSTGRVNAYTTAREYRYLLELDGSGNIVGGEWLEDSKSKHPDFLWFPTARPGPDVITRIGLSNRNVLELLTASINANC